MRVYNAAAMTHTEQTPRDRAVKRIKALLTKTVASGCTPGEAAAAADLALKLMAKHGVTEADLQDSQLYTLAGTVPADVAAKAWLYQLLSYAGSAADSAVLLNGTGDVSFTAKTPGAAQLAHDLFYKALDLALLWHRDAKRAHDKRWQAYTMHFGGFTPVWHADSYLLGFADGVAQRYIHDQAQKAKAERAAEPRNGQQRPEPQQPQPQQPAPAQPVSYDLVPVDLTPQQQVHSQLLDQGVPPAEQPKADHIDVGLYTRGYGDGWFVEPGRANMLTASSPATK